MRSRLIPRSRVCSFAQSGRLVGFVVLGLVTTRLAAEENAYVRPSESRLRADVTYLASDLREGRGAGTEGLEAAANYIAGLFREAGLKPAPGAEGYFQAFEIPGDLRSIEPTRLAVTGPDGTAIDGILHRDFVPLQRGGSGEFQHVPVVFAGYGITANDESSKLQYDDYAGLDVKGKAVLILRQEPDTSQADSPFAGKDNTSYATYRHKARNAADHGAVAVLLANNRPNVSNGKDTLLGTTNSDGDGSGIPFIMVTRDFADRILKAGKAPSLEELEHQIDVELKPKSRVLDGITLDGEIRIEKKPYQVKNVIGVLEGAGPTADETIVVGAHYDHVGYGGAGSLAPGVRDIHNGADDNASGTAMVLELARRMAQRPEPLPRRLVFMTFAGEERGLLGSRYYVEHPLYPLDKTVAMLNFDMVGRLNGDHELTVFGAPSIAGLDNLVVALAKSQGIKAKIVPDTSMEFNASDHASFYRKNIPVFFAFTGTHPDYHKPGDDTEKINFPGMTRIADLGELLLLDLARRPERPEFVKLPGGPRRPFARSGNGSTRGTGAYLGTQPAYGETIKGVKLDGVTEGSPAAKAGLQAGDVIIRLGEKAIESVENLFEVLTEKKPGDTVEIVVLRDGKEKALKATLGTRSAPN